MQPGSNTATLSDYERHEVVDPVANAVEHGIKREIDAALDAQCWRATVMLTYAGMDAVAALDRPSGSKQAGGAGFKAWSTRYVCPLLPGVDADALYQARCAMLHSYGVKSQRQSCPSISYVAERGEAERYELCVTSDTIIISVRQLRDVFFTAVEAFLNDVQQDAARRKKVREHAAALATALNLNHSYVVIST